MYSLSVDVERLSRVTELPPQHVALCDVSILKTSMVSQAWVVLG